jgi:hypothetical protein
MEGVNVAKKSKKKCPFEPAGDPVDITFDALTDASTLPGVSYDDALEALGLFVAASIGSQVGMEREDEGDHAANRRYLKLAISFAYHVARVAKVEGVPACCALNAILAGVRVGLGMDVDALLQEQHGPRHLPAPVNKEPLAQ